MNLVEQIFGTDRLAQIQDVTALKWATGSCTYRQLASRIQVASFELSNRGIKIEQRVVFQCAETVDFVAAYFAVLNIGAVAIAVSTRLDAKELTYVLEDSCACALIVDSICDSNNPQQQSELPQLTQINLDELPIFEDATQELQTVERSEHHEALWVYSSGTTSRPKGIVHKHGDISACVAFHLENLQVKRADLIFCTSKISFAYALANGLLAPLRLGATVFLHPDWITTDAVRTIIAEQQPRIVFSVPSVYRHLLDQLSVEAGDLFAVPEHYVSAGEHLPGEVRQRWRTMCKRDIINVYGCSETLFLALASQADETPMNSLGTVLPNVSGEVMAMQNVQPDENSAQGVLFLTHPFMFSHYANRVQDSREKLLDGVFNTGDLFRQDSSGHWYHLGREDELLKVSGQWVYLREIEKVAGTSTVARELAVVSAQDNFGMFRPALFFQPIGEQSVNEATARMRQHVEQQLPKIKRPSWIRVVETLPKTVNGKIRRAALQQMVAGLRRDD